MHQDPDRCLTTDGLEVELTPNGLWVESRHRTDGARCAFIAARRST